MNPRQAKKIGDLLRRHREEAGLSLRDLEARTGVENVQILRLEAGSIAKPDVDKLARISRTLGLSLTEVLAEAGVTSGADLPSLPVYLRTRYGDLPEEAVQRIDRYVARLAREHGLDPAGPTAGEDEETPPRRKRTR